MSERERDERDLVILSEYGGGESKAGLMRKHSVTRSYLTKLLEEAIPCRK